MIAAAKMKKAQNQALKGRSYMEKLKEIIGNLAFYTDLGMDHPLLQKRSKVKRAGYVFFTANRGLCGAFNSNVIRKMLGILAEKNDVQELVITVGKKGRQSMERIGKSVLADFEGLTDKAGFVETLGISKVIMDDYMSGKLDEVWLVYNHFYSTLSQKPVMVKLLPIDLTVAIEKPVVRRDYLFEPNKKAVLNDLLKRYVETMIYQTFLESLASEHSSRMVAMRQASDNAHEIVSRLNLHYNKARQSKITTQILEVVAGSTAQS